MNGNSCPSASTRRSAPSSGARSAGAASPAKSAAASHCPKTSRLHTTADAGPPVPDEYLYSVVDALDDVAKETGKTVPQIALNWLLQRPTVASVIIGARNEEQLRQNLGAVGWNLTPEQVAQLDAASAATARLSLLAPGAVRRPQSLPRPL